MTRIKYRLFSRVPRHTRTRVNEFVLLRVLAGGFSCAVTTFYAIHFLISSSSFSLAIFTDCGSAGFEDLMRRHICDSSIFTRGVAISSWIDKTCGHSGCSDHSRYSDKNAGQISQVVHSSGTYHRCSTNWALTNF